MVQSQPGQTVPETLSQKHPTQNRTGGVAQVVECLPSKHEALSSNQSTDRKKKKGKIANLSPIVQGPREEEVSRLTSARRVIDLQMHLFPLLGQDCL
jgi:hypothetical protein